MKVSADGPMVVDLPDFPEFVKNEANQHREAFEWLKTVEDVKWNYQCPPGSIQPGRRTKKNIVGSSPSHSDRTGPELSRRSRRARARSPAPAEAPKAPELRDFTSTAQEHEYDTRTRQTTQGPQHAPYGPIYSRSSHSSSSSSNPKRGLINLSPEARTRINKFIRPAASATGSA